MSRKIDPVAKAVITLALTVWGLGIIATRPGAPSWLGGVFVAVTVAGVVFVVTFGILRNSGWRDLAAAFPADPAFRGPWYTCRTAIMSPLSLDDPDHRRRRMRFSFLLRIGADKEALRLSTPALVSWLLPPICIPLSAIAAARPFDASGWVVPASEPGTLLQFMFDPGFRGQFVEIEIAQPHYFLQLPAAAGEGVPRAPRQVGAG